MDKPIVQMTISIILVIALMLGAYLIVIKKPHKNKVAVEVDTTEISTIVSSDPKKTVANFIKANGTMGNIETDINDDTLTTNQAIYSNGTRRLESLEKIEQAVVPGNEIIMGNERNNIKNFVRNLDYPVIYEIQNIEVSEPSEPENLVVFSEYGPTEYKSVKVYANFESVRIHYTCPKDITYAGVHRQFKNTEYYDNIEVILVEIDKLWFVYDIPEAEKLINERFASWSGRNVSTINYDKNIESGSYIIKDFVPPEGIDYSDELLDLPEFPKGDEFENDGN